MKKLIFLYLTFLIASLAAQDLPDKSCRLVVIDGPRKIFKDYFIFDGVSSQPIKMSRMNLSPTYRLDGKCRKIWVLNKPIDDPKLLPEGMPFVDIPNGTQDALIFAMTDQVAEYIPLKLFALNIGFKKFLNGDMLWINLSKHSVKGTLGKSTLNVSRLRAAIVKMQIGRDLNFVMDLKYLAPNATKYYPLYKGKVMHNPRARRIMFIYDDSKRPTPRWKGYADYRTPETRLPAEDE